MRQRPLGDYTDLAWLRGWDAGITGHGANQTPHKRRAQRLAWESGRSAGLRSDDNAVAALQRVVGRRKAAGLPLY